MPEFKIKMPDGQIRTVRGPDRDGAMAFAMANYNPATTSAPTTTAQNPRVNPEGHWFRSGCPQGCLPDSLCTSYCSCHG